MAENCSERGGNSSDGVIFYVTNISLAVITALIGLSGSILNSLVIASVVKTPSLQCCANLSVCGLAASDLLTGVITLPVYMTARLTRVLDETNNCLVDSIWRLYEISLYLILGASHVQLCLMSFDRYKAVSDPFTYRARVTKRTTIKSTVVAWIAWILLAIITTFLVPQPQGKYIQSFAGVFFFIVPVVAQIAAYKAIRRHNRQIARADARTTAVTLAREKAMAVTLRYVTGTIFGCLMVPTAAFTATFFVKNKLYNQYGVPWTIEVCFMTTFINPLLYFMRHADMRTAAARLLGW